MTTLRLATYNIRAGKGASGREGGAVDRLGRALASERLEVLLAQEVYHRFGGVSQSGELGRSLGLRAYYEPNRTRRHGHVGNATFVGLPVELVENHDVSTNPIERRGVLYLRLHWQGRPLHLLNVHLGLNQPQRLRQLAHIREILASRTRPDEAVVLAGDFNDWNRRLDRLVVGQLGLHNAFAHLRGAAALTWHVRRPLFCLDRVYLRHLRPVVARRLAGAPWNVLSDHFPLWAEVERL